MKTLVVILLIVFAASQKSATEGHKQCFTQAKQFYGLAREAVELGDVEEIIDSLEQVSERVPELLRACGAQEEAKTIQEQFPPVCTKLLAREAKLMVKIMRLYVQDKDKNQKSIAFYSTMLQTIYKTQVQKKCVYFQEHHISQIKNKTKCGNEAYKLSIIYAQLDHDLVEIDLNNSLVDMGSLIAQIPTFLDGCSQQKLASIVRLIFPKICISAIGDMVNEIVTIEHHSNHLEWIKDHALDFTKALSKLKSNCIALSLLKGK